MKVILRSNNNALSASNNNSSMSKSQPLGTQSSVILRNTGAPEKDTFVSFKGHLNGTMGKPQTLKEMMKEAIKRGINIPKHLDEEGLVDHLLLALRPELHA